GIFLALWTLGTALESAGTWDPQAADHPRRSWLSRQRLGPLLRWAGFGAWTAGLAGGLAAIQFLPPWEAAGLSMRSPGMPLGDLLDGCIRSIQFFFGPALVVNQESWSLQWEDRGGFGVVWFAAAATAPLLRRGKVRYWAGVAGLLVLFAFGGCPLVRDLPRFRPVPQHAGMLMIVPSPAAVLVGVTTQSLLTQAETKLGRKVLVRVLISFAILIGGSAVRLALSGFPLRFHPYWLTLLLTVPAAWWLL